MVVGQTSGLSTWRSATFWISEECKRQNKFCLKQPSSWQRVSNCRWLTAVEKLVCWELQPCTLIVYLLCRCLKCAFFFHKYQSYCPELVRHYSFRHMLNFLLRFLGFKSANLAAVLTETFSYGGGGRFLRVEWWHPRAPPRLSTSSPV